jgi:hypothetical protein
LKSSNGSCSKGVRVAYESSLIGICHLRLSTSPQSTCQDTWWVTTEICCKQKSRTIFSTEHALNLVCTLSIPHVFLQDGYHSFFTHDCRHNHSRLYSDHALSCYCLISWIYHLENQAAVLLFLLALPPISEGSSAPGLDTDVSDFWFLQNNSLHLTTVCIHQR